MDIKKMAAEIEQFVDERAWDQFHSIKNLTMALNVEAAELMEIFQWLSEDVSNQVGHDAALKVKVQDELADVLYYLIRISHKADIDLAAALESKMQKNAEKYPVALSKGNCKKYDEL
jgi:dCTP diphosphatase